MEEEEEEEGEEADAVGKDERITAERATVAVPLSERIVTGATSQRPTDAAAARAPSERIKGMTAEAERERERNE